MPSRFLQEIPGELIETAEGSLADAGETRRYEPDPEYSYSEEEFTRRMRGAAAPSRSSGVTPIRTRSTAQPRLGRSAGAGNPLIGQRVRHATYGAGTIIGIEGDGDDRKFTVRFSDHGTKKLMERYANLSWA
jgi:hypothetical protein